STRSSTATMRWRPRGWRIRTRRSAGFRSMQSRPSPASCMSLRTWTPAALSSERRSLSGACWRLVEAQHRVSTMKLVDMLPEQHLLESILDATKPPVPPECGELHYLLSTPFRYGAPYPAGSRFRRAGLTAGVFYASAAVKTAVAEM